MGVLREKKRYIFVRIEAAEAFSQPQAKALLSQAALELLGQAGAADAAFSVKAFDPETRRAVVKCSTKSLERVLAALALKRFFEGKDVAVRVEKIAGSFSPQGIRDCGRRAQGSLGKAGGERLKSGKTMVS